MTTATLFTRALRVERDNYYAKGVLRTAEEGAKHVARIEFDRASLFKIDLPAAVYAIAIAGGLHKTVFIYHSPADRDDDLREFLIEEAYH
jgi:hypothetical protein